MLRDRAQIRAALWSKTEEPDLPPFVSPTVVGSISRATKWKEALEGIDAVIHLAARVHVMREMSRNPLAEFREVNTYGTETLARAAVAAGVKRFIYLSSIKVNGEQTEPGKPFTENDPPNPQDPYAVSKLEAERALVEIAEKSALEFVIVRPPIMYGPNVKANFLSLMKLVDRAVPLPTRSIDNKRSFLFVRNLTDFLARCLDHARAANQLFLLSDGHDVSTAELIYTLAHAMGRRDRQFSFPRPLAKRAARILGAENIYRRLWKSLQIDSTKAGERLDWRPPFCFTEGIEAAVNRYLR